MTTCVPAASGVPGLPGPPDWLTPNPQKDNLDDPRWRGSAAQGFPLLGGAAEQFSVRSLFHTTGADTTLYLSFHVRVDPHLSNLQDKLYVGFRGSTGAMVVEIAPYNGGSAFSNQPTAARAAYLPPAAPGGQWQATSEPTWIAQVTRAWLSVSPTSWAVQMAVPVKSLGSINANPGPNLGTSFGLWYFAQVYTGSSYISYEWKPGHPATSVADILTGAFPDQADWDTFQLSSAGCTTGGIGLQYLDIGTTNTPNSVIRYGSGQTNTFFARPRNYGASSVTVGQMSARFRIANWGSVADPNAPWVDIPGGAAVANDAVIGTIAAGSDPPATNPIHFNWALSAADVTNFITGKSPHKCMLVELSGAGLTFLDSSVYRNMDFVTASVFRREAEMSVVGLAPISPAPRDVYLYVETRNMPATVEQPKGGEKPEGGGGDRPVGIATHALPVAGPTVDELPTYRVHVYHDLGETVTVGGVTQSVLRPQSSFGYFLSHSGALAGWRHSLTAPPEAQLQQIGPDFYKIVVPNNGSVTVLTAIQAVEPGIQGILEGCLMTPVNLLLVLFRGVVKGLEALRDRLGL